MSLDAWLQDGLGSCVSERGAVLVQQVHELLQNLPKTEKKTFNVTINFSHLVLSFSLIHVLKICDTLTFIVVGTILLM